MFVAGGVMPTIEQAVNATNPFIAVISGSNRLVIMSEVSKRTQGAIRSQT